MRGQPDDDLVALFIELHLLRPSEGLVDIAVLTFQRLYARDVVADEVVDAERVPFDSDC